MNPNLKQTDNKRSNKAISLKKIEELDCARNVVQGLWKTRIMLFQCPSYQHIRVNYAARICA
jgi:hypothetical protein